MKELWRRIRYGKRCTSRMPGSLRGPEWTQCIHRGEDHPAFMDTPEHYNGVVWWT